MITPRAGGSLVSQLAAALQLLDRHCRSNALGAPVELGNLVRLLARDGQKWPTLDLLATESDTANVPALLLTFEAAADVLAVSERTVRRLVAAKDLPFVKIGGARRIPRSALVEYVDNLQNLSTTDRKDLK